MRKTWGIACVNEIQTYFNGIQSLIKVVNEIEQSFYSLEEAEAYARKQAALNQGKRYTVVAYIEQYHYPEPGPVVEKFDQDLPF